MTIFLLALLVRILSHILATFCMIIGLLTIFISSNEVDVVSTGKYGRTNSVDRSRGIDISLV